MKRIKIYTKTGDRGQTSLFGGKRVWKNNQRVDTYGNLDELSSLIGFAISFDLDKKVKKVLEHIQNDLLNIGAQLANPKKLGADKSKVFIFGTEKALSLEKLIDRYDSKLEPLRTFILPGGTKAAAFLHFSRATSRRVERALVSLNRKETINPHILEYINRLSDLLFVLARYLNKRGKFKETLWDKN